MADYDWFTPTDRQLEEQAERAKFMAENYLVYVTFDKQLACTLCGCLIAGTLEHNWWRRHRTRCRDVEPQRVEGKHRRF